MNASIIWVDSNEGGGQGSGPFEVCLTKAGTWQEKDLSPQDELTEQELGEIDALQQRPQLEPPPSYREFLLVTNGLWMKGHTFTRLLSTVEVPLRWIGSAPPIRMRFISGWWAA